MGYTHYFTIDARDVFEDAREIVAASTVTICGAWGEGAPVITEEKIAINGCAENDEDYEDFCLEAGGTRSFCKTGHRPYDEVVTAILVAAAVNGSYIGSDGYFEEFKDGIALYERAVRPLTDKEKSKLLSILG